MKFVKVLSIAALVVIAGSTVRADDTRVNMNGGPGGSPTCGSNLAMVDGLSSSTPGVLTADCEVRAVGDMGGQGEVFAFSFEVADSNTIGGGLTCKSQLSANLGWTLATQTVGGIDICSLTAPSSVSSTTKEFLRDLHDPYTGHNDHDCDFDDFVLGIPVGCDIKIDNTKGGFSPFVPGAPVGFASNGSPLPSLPEPGTFALLLMGLTGLPLLRRKTAR